MKKATTLKVLKKRNGKFYVRKRGGELVNGAEKQKVLVEQGKVTLPKSKVKEAPAEG